jgi:hypothetical protein
MQQSYKFAYNNPFKLPKPISGYVSDSFNPLPQLRSRINDILSPKKRIRFISSRITTKDISKLPDIKRETKSEAQSHNNNKNEIHTRTSLLRQAKNTKQTIAKKKNRLSSFVETKITDDLYDDLDDYIEEDYYEPEIIEKKVTKFQIDNDRNNAKRDNSEDVVVLKNDSDDNLEIFEKEKIVVVVDMRREAVKNRFRKALLANRSIAKLKEDNILLKIGKQNDDEDPFTSSDNDARPAAVDQSKTTNLKFGSSLSEDGNYTMLKCYEDMLSQDIRKMYPKTDEMTRTKTSTFIRLPRKFDSKKHMDFVDNQAKLQQLSTAKNSEVELAELKKHRIRVSRQLEKAMVITDKIKQRKGELVTSADGKNVSFGHNNIINAYEMWTTNWKKMFS